MSPFAPSIIVILASRLIVNDLVADALLDYHDLGVRTFLIRGFDPLEDVVDYGRTLIPRVRELVAQRDAQRKAA